MNQQSDNNPKVSVLMVTYNHEKYIAQAIESVLMQETNFNYELIIGEDYSTDGTREIVKEYAAKYPNKIRTLLHPKNLGSGVKGVKNGRLNFIATFKACQGKYIAILEGDDYWTNIYKLQKQVNFLDNNPNFSICFHNALAYKEDNTESNYYCCSEGQKQILTLEDLLVKNMIPTCSVMFRNSLVTNFPDWFYRLKQGDWSLHIINAQHGNIYYINEIMSVHRLHQGGVWSSQKYSWQTKSVIEALEAFDVYFSFKYEKLIKISILERQYKLIKQLWSEQKNIKNSDNQEIKKYLIKYIIIRLLNFKLIDKHIINIALQIYFPIVNQTYINLKKNTKAY